MRKICVTSSFKRDYERAIKNYKNLDRLKLIIRALSKGEKLPKQFKDHSLKGNYSGYRECHVYPDLLLIYKLDDDGEIKLILLYRLGSHAKIFNN